MASINVPTPAFFGVQTFCSTSLFFMFTSDTLCLISRLKAHCDTNNDAKKKCDNTIIYFPSLEINCR